MRKFLAVCFMVLLGLVYISASISGGKIQDINEPQSMVKATGVASPGMVTKDPDFGKIPLYFIPNQGQVDEEARFYAQTSRYTLWMTKEGLVFDSVREARVVGKDEVEEEGETNCERDVSRLTFPGSNKNPVIVPVEITPHRVNYYQGKDSSKWQEGIRTSKAVLYKDVYKNIDLKVYGVENQVEYDWIVKPGANPRSIKLKYQQAAKTGIDKEGNLIVETRFGQLVHKKPLSYQVIDGKRVPVNSRFEKIAKNTYGFNVESYNKDHELIIDPMLAIIYSTYLGGSANDEGAGMKVDSTGIYVIGYTTSSNFPRKGPCIYPIPGRDDVFVSKLNPDGSDLIYSVIIGGSSLERGIDIVVLPNGHVMGTGYTYSNNLPANNSYFGNRDMIFFELDENGCRVCLRYIGGSFHDSGAGIAVDSANIAYISGYTNSSNFPVTAGAFQSTSHGDYDACIVKISCAGIHYATYLGGSGKDCGYEIAVDASNCFYITGYTDSSNFPIKYPCVPSRFDHLSGTRDAFVTKLKADGSDLVYSIYLGGSGRETGHSITVDGSGAAYVSGATNSPDFPIKNAIQDKLVGDYDGFICKLKPDGCDLVYSTYLGGRGNENTGEYMGDIAVNNEGETYITGSTNSDNFPVHNPFQWKLAGGIDTFVTKYTFSDAAPVLWVDKELLNFGVNSAGTTTGAQQLLIRNIGGGTLEWNIAVSYDRQSINWLTCTPESGKNCGIVTVSVNAAGLSADTYKATITITDAKAANSPQKVYVTMRVNPSGLPTQPFGAFETPLNNGVVNGSVPFSGWALDDIEVTKIEIKYGTPPNLTYVGDATFVECARPDVAQVYPNYPYYCRAGWGYVLQSNLFGNGSYSFHAIATDREGNQVDLGPKTVIITSSVKPFGAIDTPAPGGIASGSNYRIQGWALTPLPKCVTKVEVFIDSEYKGLATFGDISPDIEAKFPGYCNSSHARFHFDFNTIGMRNGCHTLYCKVTDDGTASDNFGHRYFYIVNYGSIDSPPDDPDQPFYALPKITDLPVNYWQPVETKNGFDEEIEPRLINPDKNGNIYIEMKELERIEVKLAPDRQTSGQYYTGYHLIGNQVFSLPIGSTLDSENGIFYWQPGPGFLGTFQFVFIENGSDGAISKKFVTVKILPKFYSSQEE